MVSSATSESETVAAENLTQTPRFQRLRLLSRLLDNAIPVPGTSYRFGLDPILGLIPAAGDLLGFLLSVFIIWESAQFGASRPTLIRMSLNVIFEAILGIVPLLGDVMDVVWKANAKNLELLELEIGSPHVSRRTNQLFLIILLAGLGAILLALIAITVVVIGTLLNLLSARLFDS